MKIVVAVTNDLNFDQRMIRSCTALAEAGYDVHFVGRELAYSPDLEPRPYSQHRLKCNVNQGPAFYAEYAVRLRSHLADTEFDLAIACDLDTILPITLVCQRRKIPFVYDAHEYFTEVPELEGRHVVKSIWSLIGQKCVKRAAACYTVGPKLAGVLSKEFGMAFEVVRNVPFRSGRPIMPYADRDPVILYQGALNEGRGIETAIDAMLQIDGLELHLAGEGDLSDMLRSRVRDSGLNPKVKFLGRVTPAALSEITDRVLIGLNLLENKGLSYYYSLANKFFDYMQAGTPSVNMNFPEYAQLLSEDRTGTAMARLDIETYVHAIESLRQEQEWQKMSQACEIARERHNWENEKVKLIDLIGRVLNG